MASVANAPNQSATDFQVAAAAPAPQIDMNQQQQPAEAFQQSVSPHFVIFILVEVSIKSLTLLFLGSMVDNNRGDRSCHACIQNTKRRNERSGMMAD